MQYEILTFNDNGTAKVRMTINGNVLEQDFDIEGLDENVKQGMAIFKEELDKNTTPEVDESLIGKIVTVSKLPDIGD